METLHAVLLDIDGTLVDSNDAHARAWQDALGHFGHSVPFAQLRALIGKGGDKLLAETVGIDNESPQGKQIDQLRKRNGGCRAHVTRACELAISPEVLHHQTLESGLAV